MLHSAKQYRIWLLGVSCWAAASCGNEHRAEGESGVQVPEPDASQLDSDPVEEDSTLDSVEDDAEADGAPPEDAAPIDVDSAAQDVDGSAPDAGASCPEVAVECTSADGVPVESPAMYPLFPLQSFECRTSVREAQQATTVWTVEVNGRVRERFTQTDRYDLQFVQPGEASIRASLLWNGVVCDATPAAFSIAPPEGLYLTLQWNASEAPASDLDVHLVRDGFCFEDLEEDLHFRNREERFDWGESDVTADDPQYLFDARSSPGVETAWIVDPSSMDIVHYGVHGFRVQAGGAAAFSVSVYYDGERVLDAALMVNQGEYVPIGALADGRWVPASVAVNDSGASCPRLPAD